MLIFFPFLGTRDLWTSGEARVAQVARQMRFAGGSRGWIVPMLGSKVRLKKPPLAYWMAAVCSLPFADVDEFNARIPNALAAILAMCMLYILGRDLFDRNTGLISAITLGTTSVFWWQARTSNLEMPLLALNLTAVTCWWKYREARKPDPQAGPAWLLAGYAALGLAWLQKGPVGPLLILLICTVYLTVTCEWRRYRFRVLHHLAGIALMFAIALPWPLLVLHHLPNAWDLWVHESAGRYKGFDHIKKPFYFVLKILGDGQPWVIPGLLMPFLLRGHEREERVRLLLPIVWMVVCLVFFSIPASKKSYYILFIYPALALMAGYLVARAAVARGQGAREPDSRSPESAYACRLWRGYLYLVGGIVSLAALAGCAGLGAQVLGLYPVFEKITRNTQINAVYSSHVPHLVAGVTVAMAGGLLLLRFARQQAYQRAFGLIIAITIMYMATHTAMLPDLNHHKADKHLCSLLRPRLKPGDRTFTYGMSGVPIMTFYLSRARHVQHVERLQNEGQIMQQIEALTNARIYLMTKTRDLGHFRASFVLRASAASNDKAHNALMRMRDKLLASGKIRILGQGTTPSPAATDGNPGNQSLSVPPLVGRDWLIVSAGKSDREKKRFIFESDPVRNQAIITAILAGNRHAWLAPFSACLRRLDFPDMPNHALWLEFFPLPAREFAPIKPRAQK